MDDINKKTFSFSMRLVLVSLLLFLQSFLSGIAVAARATDSEVVLRRERAASFSAPGSNKGRADPAGQSRNASGQTEIRIGLYENKPKIYTGEAGRASGIFPAVINEIARRENWQLTYVPCQWFECLDALENGRIDLMPDVAYSQERDERFDFHREEVVNSWSGVYANGKNKMSKISDLEGRRIVVLKGSIQQQTLKQLVNGLGIKVDFLEAGSFGEAFSLGAGGAADGVVANHFFGDFFHRQYGLNKTPIVFNPVSLYFATASGANREVLEAIDKHLRTMKSEPGSVYYRVLVRWLEKPPKLIIPPYFVWLITGISGLLVLAFAFILLLRWQVKAGTRHLDQANEQLRDSEKKFRDLFHRHAAVKLLINPGTGDIIEANQAAEKFYGWSGEQLRRMRIQEINVMPPDEFMTAMAKAESMERTQFESRHQLADGTIRDVAVFSSGIEVQGVPLLHSIIHDITEHRQLEEQLQQAQKMESVGRLAGGVAHDFNNMLSVILGYSEMALERTDPSGPVHADLEQVLKAARRSTDIVRQLLVFARKQVVAPVVLDLNESVEGMLKMLRRLIGEDIDLTWLPARDLGLILIDPSQVDQIMANLCVNARDAIVDVGKITIETVNMTLDDKYCAEHADAAPGNFVMLAVSDDGCGMDRETLGHVFEPFFTTKGMGEGTGLGLATVYGIVKQNGGFINIYSEPGKGTTFRIYLPRHEGKVDRKSPGNGAEIPQGKGEILLLVEDDQAIMELGRMILGDLGYRVLSAATPGEAMRLAEEHAGDIDLLVTDVVMPEMNGRDLADRLRTLYPDLKILFMSGYTADVIAHRGVLDEGVNFIAKPFSRKDIAVKVRDALGRGGGDCLSESGSPAI